MENGELSRRERGRLWLRLGVRLALAALVVGVLALAGPPLLSLFMPFVLAFLLSWMLNPLIKWIQRHVGISRKILSFLLILVIFAGVGGLLAAFVYNIVAEIISLANNWQSILASAKSAMDAMGAFFSDFLKLLPPEVGQWVGSLSTRFLEWLQAALPAMLSAAAAGATNVAMGVPSFAVALVVFIMGSYFISADYPRLRFMAAGRLSDSLRGFLGRVKEAAVAAFGGYVKAQLILAVGVFFILLVGFAIIGQPYGLLLAFLLAVLDFIPIVGAGTAMVPWAVVDLFTGNVRHAVELMVIWGVIALFRRVGEPKVVGDQTGLSPILSLVSIYVGMRLGGVWGMILGPVICMVAFNICGSGVLDNTADDLRLAAGDIAAFMKNRPGDNSKKM
ncbi:sporulation integral membrane protein YtvI [Oscillospiraceae bacterium]|nr:sporulation integral membrane protein YtvI [Oscillospiraceae bacterium]BDF76932.1 sporulation integral membrane protein YtvI [Oscillospiraceae bacterium]